MWLLDRIRLRSTVSAIIAVNIPQAKKRYTNRSGQPKNVASANTHSMGGLKRTTPKAKSATSRSLRRASLGMMLKSVLAGAQLPRHVGRGDELAEAGDAALLAVVQQAQQDRRCQ